MENVHKIVGRFMSAIGAKRDDSADNEPYNLNFTVPRIGIKIIANCVNLGPRNFWLKKLIFSYNFKLGSLSIYDVLRLQGEFISENVIYLLFGRFSGMEMALSGNRFMLSTPKKRSGDDKLQLRL